MGNLTQSFLGNPASWKAARLQLTSLQALWGGWVVTALGNGEAIVQHVSHVRLERRYRFDLGQVEVTALFEACVGHDLLALPGPQRPGVPDEIRMGLTLVNPQGEARTVTKWAGDRQEAFEAVMRPLFALTARTEKLEPFLTGPFDWPGVPGGLPA